MYATIATKPQKAKTRGKGREEAIKSSWLQQLPLLPPKVQKYPTMPSIIHAISLNLECTHPLGHSGTQGKHSVGMIVSAVTDTPASLEMTIPLATGQKASHALHAYQTHGELQAFGSFRRRGMNQRHVFLGLAHFSDSGIQRSLRLTAFVHQFVFPNSSPEPL